MNLGIIESKPNPTDWVAGADTKIEELVLQENRNWEDYLPPLEHQKINGYETYGCVSFSALNCVETLVKRKYKLDWNKSDRFTVVKSGTIRGKGNYLNRVGDSIRRDGLVEESDWPFQKKAYYSVIPEDIEKMGIEFTKFWETQYEWVDWAGCNPDELWKALQFAPIQVTVRAWDKPNKDGVYDKINKKTNHAVMLYKGEYGKYWYIYDHYKKDKKKLSWDFYFGSAYKYNIKPMNDFIKVIKDKDSNAVGFWIPATSPEALDSMAHAFQKPVVKTDDGEVDWQSTIEGELILKKNL